MENEDYSPRVVFDAQDLTDFEKTFLITAIRLHGANIGRAIEYLKANSGMIFSDEQMFRDIFRQAHGATPRSYYSKHFARKFPIPPTEERSDIPVCYKPTRVSRKKPVLH